MGTVFVTPITRHPDHWGFTTARDPLDDLILHLEFLTAKDSAAELLRSLDETESDIPDRAAAVSTHAKTTRAFLEQARASPETVGFVSAYYAALNLSKICVLFSPLYAELEENRYHGVTYNPSSSPSSLAEDEVTIKTGGAIPLFYQIVSGERIPAKTRIRMRDVYCLVSDISSEWSMATGGVPWLADMRFRSYAANDSEGLEVLVQSGLSDPLSLDQLPVLRNVEVVDGKPGSFRSLETRPKGQAGELFEDILDRRLLYYSQGSNGLTAIGNISGLTVVEDLPLLLAFYHMSSVARYNPEFLDSVRTSRYWPVAASLTTHGLYKFLLLAWSHIRRRHVWISRA